MSARAFFYSLGPLVIAASAVGAAIPFLPGVPAVGAQPCPDTEVVFARGTGEPPGLGPTGQAFVNALNARVGANAVAAYAVDYPATDQWDTGADGIWDAGAHVVSRATTCPRTKMVLGGYSQGAAVMGFITSHWRRDQIRVADPAEIRRSIRGTAIGNLHGVVRLRCLRFQCSAASRR